MIDQTQPSTRHADDRPIGIMGAMADETRAVISGLTTTSDPITHGGRRFHVGTLHGRSVVVVTSRCGKVSAAATATELIVRFNVSALLFTGVGGGLGADVRVGDLVVASDFVQHDMDARPLFPQFEIPLLGTSCFQADQQLATHAERLLRGNIERFRHEHVHIDAPAIHRGQITSGDQFVATAARRNAILADLPDALCVEMEGAAVAQVAHEYGVPLCVIRTISDMADGSAPGVFEHSLAMIASEHAAIVAELMLQTWPDQTVQPANQSEPREADRIGIR